MYLLLAFSILAASLNSVILHRLRFKQSNDIFRFNQICSMVWCVILFVINKCTITITGPVLFWGLLYGLLQALFILFKTAAMNSGPVSITTLIGNCSLLLSIPVSVLIWKESVSLIQVLGVILLMVAIVMCTYQKSAGTFTIRWGVYTILFFLTAASVGITFKAFSKSAASEHAGDMMLVSAIVMTVVYFLISTVLGSFKPGLPTAGRSINPVLSAAGRSHQSSLTALGHSFKSLLAVSGHSFLLPALLSGVLSCAYNRLNIYLSGKMDAIIFFPGFNGGVIVLSTLLSILMLKERLSTQQNVGLVLGVLAICILGFF